MIPETCRLLIVDDDPGLALNLQDILEDRGGYSAVVAQDAQHALALCHTERLDLALVDVRLPDMMGERLIRELAAIQPDMEFIVMTAHVTLESATQAVEQKNIVAYETKPLDLPRFLPLLDQIVQRRQATRALRDSERQYRQLIENLGEGVWRIDKDGYTSFVNPLMADILGYTVDEMLGKHLFTFMDEQGVEIARRKLVRRQQGIKEEHEFKFRRKDGNPIYALLSTAPILDEQGRYTGAIAGVQDITARRHAEEALQESEARYRSLYASMSEGVALHRMVYDPSGQASDYVILDVNPAYETLTGIARADAIGKLASELYGPGRPPDLETYAEVVATGRPAQFETSPKSLQKCYKVSAFSLERGIFATVFEDITARKQAEEERKTTVDLLGLINVTSDLHETIKTVMVYLKRWAGCEAVGIRLREGDDYPYFEAQGFPEHFVQMERRLCAEDGAGNLLRDEAGNPVLECMCGNILCRRFDPTKPFFTAYGSFWTNGTTALLASTTEADRQGRTRNRCNDAGYESVALIPLRAGEETLGLIQLNDHRPGRFSPELIALLERLADQVAKALSEKRAKEALRRNEERLSRALLGAPFPIMVHAEDGRVIMTSKAWHEITGYKPEEIATIADWTMKAYGARSEAVQADIGRLYTTAGHVQVGEVEVLTASGEKRIWDMSAAVLGQLADGTRLAITMAMDVTERRKLEDQLRQAVKMEAVGRLAGGVAHDFNNLLTVIQGHAQFALRSVPAVNPACEDLQEVITASQRAASLTRQLLAFSRRQVLELHVINLNQIIGEMSKMLVRLLGEDITLRLRLADDLGNVRADPGQIEQVIVNLAVNARDAMPQGGILTITTANVELDAAFVSLHTEARLGNAVLLSVADTGYGMAAEVKEHLFEPFFTTKAVGKGTGLGLATIYGIIKQSGGNIYVDSEPGRGTTFHLYLPRLEEATSAASATANTALPRGTETILLVEDQTEVRLLTMRMLRSLGYQVLEAPRPADALQLCQTRPELIHLVVSDVVMPEMSGPTLVERLCQMRQGLRVLYISGYTDEAVSSHGSLVGSSAPLLQKPFTLESLARHVREALDASRGAPLSSPKPLEASEP